MMIDYPALKQLLADVENPRKVKFVSQDIKRHCQDPRFLSLLQSAIKDKNLPSNNQLAAALVLSKVIGQIYLKWNEEILVQKLMEIITDMQVQHRIKQTLQKNLTSILQVSNQNLFIKILQRAAELLIKERQQISMQIESDSIETEPQIITTVTLILKCLMNSKVHFQIFAKAIFQVFLHSNLFSIKGDSVKQVKAMISLAYFWKQLLQFSRNGGTKEHRQLFEQLVRSKNLTQWIFFLYKHNIVQGQIIFINPQPNVNHDTLRNLKLAAANLHKQILIGLHINTQLMNEEIAKANLNQIAGISNTINIFHTYRHICEKYQDFIVQLIQVTILFIKLFRNAMQPNYERILHSAIFPLLMATKEQEQLFQDNAHEFNSLAEDCCDKQVYGISKTEAAKLLQAICDDSDSAATHTIHHAIVSVKARFNVEASYSLNLQDFLTVQQAFTILAILSYRIGKNQLLLEQIRNILNTQQVVSKTSPLELSRFFQFLAYNYPDLYPQYYLGQSWVKLALRISVQEVLNYPSLVYAALDFISNILQNCYIEDVAMKYLQQLNGSKDCDLRFKILQKIISKHFMSFSQKGLSLALAKLLQLVLKDVESYNKNEKDHTLDIAHSLQICQKIASKPQRIRLYSQVRTRVWEFVTHFQLFRKIHKDDQIVKIVIAFIKIEGISSQVNAIRPKLIQILRPTYSQTSILVFLNEIGLRISDPIESGIFQLLLEGTAHLHTNVLYHPTSVTDNIALGTILLTLQHIVFVHGSNLSIPALNELVESVMLIIPISDEPEDKTQSVIIARALNLLFICHMYKRDERALRKMQQFSDVFLFKNYDLNVLTICLTKQLFKQIDIVSVTQMIILLVNSIWKTRQQQPNLKQDKKGKNKLKSTYNKFYKNSDYYASLKDMTKPFEYDILPQFILRQALSKMNHNNSCLYQSLIKSLPNNVAQRLKQLISEVTIEGRKRKIIKTGIEKHNYTQSVGIPSINKRNFIQFQEDSNQMNQDEGTFFGKAAMKKKRKQEEKSNSNL